MMKGAPTLALVVQDAAETYSDALVFLDSAIAAAMDSPYEDPERVRAILEAMGRIARRRRDGLLGTPLREAFSDLGIDYRGAIARTTPARLREQYRFAYNGSLIEAEEHRPWQHVRSAPLPPRILLIASRDRAAVCHHTRGQAFRGAVDDVTCQCRGQGTAYAPEGCAYPARCRGRRWRLEPTGRHRRLKGRRCPRCCQAGAAGHAVLVASLDCVLRWAQLCWLVIACDMRKPAVSVGMIEGSARCLSNQPEELVEERDDIPAREVRSGQSSIHP